MENERVETLRAKRECRVQKKIKELYRSRRERRAKRIMRAIGTAAIDRTPV